MGKIYRYVKVESKCHVLLVILITFCNFGGLAGRPRGAEFGSSPTQVHMERLGYLGNPFFLLRCVMQYTYLT